MDASAVDLDAQASAQLSGEIAPDAAESNAPLARKVVVNQWMDKKEYVATDLAAALHARKNKAGHAKYWDRVGVDVVSVEEKEGQETVSYDKVVVRCLDCGCTHCSKNVNVANFASTHFEDHKGKAICKRKSAKGWSQIC
jgi:hypothetical protein